MSAQAQPDLSKQIYKSTARRRKLLERFFDVVGFDFQAVYEFIQRRKRASFREVDYDFFLAVLGLPREYK